MEDLDSIYQDIGNPFDKMYSSVVKIHAHTGGGDFQTGSGFLVSGRYVSSRYSLLATCFHVVEGADDIKLTWFDKEIRENSWEHHQTIWAYRRLV